MNQSTLHIAATADLHVRVGDDLTYLREGLAKAIAKADVLLIAGDLVDVGRLAEMEYLASVLADIPVPVFAVLGNHDRRGMRKSAMIKVLRKAGVRTLDGTSALVEIEGRPSLGVAGLTGTGGGFRPEGEEPGAGSRVTRAAMIKSHREAARLRQSMRNLNDLNPDTTVVMTHFSPVADTLVGEPPLKYWMLGNALLGRTIDEFKPALVIHGHAHLGSEIGATEAGVPVRNVAVPVCGGLRLFDLEPGQPVRDAGLIPLAYDPIRGTGREAVANVT